MADLFTSALSGMNAAQLGVATAEHNIANVNTPGFSRQQITVGSRAGQQTGAGFVGQGVDVSGVKRIYDQFLTTQVRGEQTQASYLSTYHASLQQIDNMVADPAAGMAPAMQGFFDALNGVANNPESVPARQTLLGNAQFAVNRFQAIDQRLTDIGNGITGQISNSASNVNSYAKLIATLNGSIKRAIASSQGQPPNDLLDQRDQLINQLNQEIKTTTVQQPDGTVGVFIGSGQVLVVDEQSMQLQVVQSPNDPSKVDVAYVNNGKIIYLQSNALQGGGNMGAYLAFRDQSLEPARNALGRVALGMAFSINQQNQLGQDLNGVMGGNLFTTGAPRVSMGVNNAGTSSASASITNVSALTTSDYQLRFDGSNYSMRRLSDNAVTGLGAGLGPHVVDGVTVTLTAGAVAGDSFLISPTANGAKGISLATNDPAKIAAAAPMRTFADTSNTGSMKIGAGVVDAAFTTATVTPASIITYSSATGKLSGFPAGLAVTMTSNGVATLFTAGTPVTYTDGATYSVGGISFTMTGTPNNGDKFTLGPNNNATGDSRNALLLAGLQTKNLMANGTVSLQGIYGQLVGEIGVKTHELSVTSLAQNNMLAQTIASQQAVSGVNLDEEAANLIRFQKAYQAAAKAMQIAQTMFDAIMNIK